jgi:hypothetical protein
MSFTGFDGLWGAAGATGAGAGFTAASWVVAIVLGRKGTR